MMNPTVEFFSTTALEFAEEYNHSAEFKERVRLWTGLLDKYTSPHGNVFDMGCGSGIFSFYLAKQGIQVTGIDGSREMLDICNRQKTAGAFECADFLQAELPLSPAVALGSADVIISSSVLEYLDDIENTLASFYKLLNRRGILMISLPNRNSIRRKLEMAMYKMVRRPRYYRYVKNILTIPEAKQLLMRHGFALLETHYYGRWSALPAGSGRFLPPKYVDNLFAAVCQKID